MNELIAMQLRFFLVSIMWGAILLIIYDALRIFRRVIKHGRIWIAFEDALFWMISGILIFKMMYEQNNGIIRGFSILGMTVGMLIYHNLLSKFVVKGIAFLINKTLWLIGQIIKFITKPIRFICRKLRLWFGFLFRNIKKLVKTIGKALKKLFRTVKIGVTKK